MAGPVPAGRRRLSADVFPSSQLKFHAPTRHLAGAPIFTLCPWSADQPTDYQHHWRGSPGHLFSQSKDQPGTVYSITPEVRDRKPQFIVLVAANDKSVELRYDLAGERIKK